MSVRKAHENRKKFVSYPPSSAPSDLAARRPRIIEQKQSSPKQPPIAAPSRPLHHLTGLPETCQQSRRTNDGASKVVEAEAGLTASPGEAGEEEERLEEAGYGVGEPC
jgi:hypothetical protein